MNASRLVRLAGALGLYGIARRWTRDHPRILMYHRFAAVEQPGRVTARVFEEQVAHVARHYQALRLGALIERFRAGQPAPPHAIAITVDDGYRDFHEVAFPILRRHGVPATLFVTTGFVDRELWLWPDQVRWALDTAVRTPATLMVEGMAIPFSPDPWEAIIARLLELPDADKHSAIASLAETLGVMLPAQAPPAYEAVTWDQLRAMQAAGIEVGGHTHTHPTLPKVPPEHLPDEIDYCKRRLDAELGAAPRPFCYPNGLPTDYSEIVRAAVENAGFTGAVVAHADAARHTNLYALRRHSSSSNPFQFHKAVSGLEWLGRRARGWRSAS